MTNPDKTTPTNNTTVITNPDAPSTRIVRLDDIPITGTASSTIRKRLENGLEQNLSGEDLRLFLYENWNFNDFLTAETHRDRRFFEELRNGLRDHGIPCQDVNMAKNLNIGQKIIQFVWHDLPESKLKDFRDVASAVKRERNTPPVSNSNSRNVSPTRTGTRTQTTAPASSSTPPGFDARPILAFSDGIQALLEQLAAAYNIKDDTTASGSARNNNTDSTYQGWNKTSQADFRVNNSNTQSQSRLRMETKNDNEIHVTTNPRPDTNVKPEQQLQQQTHTYTHGQTQTGVQSQGQFSGAFNNGNGGNDQKVFSADEYKLQQATRSVLDYYNKRPQFAGLIDDDWPRHLRQFLSICKPYRTTDADHSVILIHSLTPSSAAHQLLEHLQDNGVTDWSTIVARFNSRFYNAATRERVLFKLNRLRVETFRDKDDVDDNSALKKLVTEIDKLCGMVMPDDRTNQSRKRYLDNAIIGTDWSHNARSKIRSDHDFGESITILHESIDYLASLKTRNKNNGDDTTDPNFTKPSNILLGADDDDDYDAQLGDDNEQTGENDVLFQRMYFRHPYSARQQRRGGNFQHGQHRPGYRGGGNRFNRFKRNSRLTCFNCGRTDCRLNVCPMPRDAARIKANMAAWKAMRGSQTPYSRVNLSDIHLFSEEDVFEINLAEAFCERMTPATAPLSTYIHNHLPAANQQPATGSQLVPNTHAPLQPTPHTTFYTPPPVAQSANANTQLQCGTTPLAPAASNTAQQQQTPHTETSLFASVNFDYDDIDFNSVLLSSDQAPTINNNDADGSECVIPESVTLLNNVENRFFGFCLDSGAASSVSGEAQFAQFLKVTRQPIIKVPNRTRFRFGKTVTETQYRYKLRVPLSHGTYVEAQVAVVPLEIPFLIGLEVLVHYGLNMDFFTMSLRYQHTEIETPITIFDKHAYIHAMACDATAKGDMILFNKAELRKLHLHFFHPTPSQLYQLIRRTRPNEVDADTQRLLADISSECEQCQEWHSGPLRFRVKLPNDSITFNSDVAMDLAWLEGKPVLHIVCLQTRFQNACFLQSKASSAVWQALIEVWTSVYTGFPATLHLDQESSFMSQEFARYCDSQGVVISASGIESHNSLGAGESFHRQLRRVFNCIRAEHPKVEATHALRLAIKALNGTVGVNGAVPSTLVFGTTPQFPAAPRNHTPQAEKFKALQTARAETAQLTAERRVNDALRRKLPPSTSYLIRPGDLVRVYREKSGAWDGPFTVARLDRKLVTVSDGVKAKTFNVSQVLPHKTSVRDPVTSRELSRIFDNAIHSVEVLASSDPRYNNARSQEAIRNEIIGLNARGVFEQIDPNDVPEDAVILGMKFILAIKDSGTSDERYKARIVALGHKDRDKALVIHIAVPVRIRSVRLVCSYALSEKMKLWLEDTNQAYCQGKKLRRCIIVKAHPFFGLPEGTLLRLVRPLYGITEAGDAWNEQLTDVIKTEVKAKPLMTDKSLYYYRPEATRSLLGLVAIYVDDCLYAGKGEFVERSKVVSQRFDSKPRREPPFKFAGIEISRPNAYEIETHQMLYVNKLDVLSTTATFNAFRTLRHKLAWCANSRPDVLAGVNILSQVTEAKFKTAHTEKINTLVTHLKKTVGLHLKFVTLDRTKLRLIVFSDGSFAGNEDLSSQIGFIIFIADESGEANLLHCASSKTKRIVRSVLGAETLALSAATDMAISLKLDILDMTGDELPLHELTDSETLFSVMIKSTMTSELRLMIDIAAAKQSYDRHEINTISWIRRNQNLSDAMTKLAINAPLLEFMKTNRLSYDIVQSVLRKDKNKTHPDDDKRTPLADGVNAIEELEAYLSSHGVSQLEKPTDAKKKKTSECCDTGNRDTSTCDTGDCDTSDKSLA